MSLFLTQCCLNASNPRFFFISNRFQVPPLSLPKQRVDGPSSEAEQDPFPLPRTTSRLVTGVLPGGALLGCSCMLLRGSVDCQQCCQCCFGARVRLFGFLTPYAPHTRPQQSRQWRAQCTLLFRSFVTLFFWRWVDSSQACPSGVCGKPFGFEVGDRGGGVPDRWGV